MSVEIIAEAKDYRDLVLQLISGDFAEGQRTIDLADHWNPTTVGSFAEGFISDGA